jgi:hypothetical protein
MKELTQAQIDSLGPEEYARFLGHGDIELIDDDCFSEEFIRRALIEHDL